MVEVRTPEGRRRDALARVCVVDETERVLLATLVSPGAPVTDYRTEFTGLAAGDLDGAPAFDAVQAQVAALLRGPGDPPPLLVGHGLENDLAVLRLSHPPERVRDTALHAPLQRATTGKAHKLRDLVALHLGYVIQAPGAAHDPEEDAVGAMRLYHRVRGLAARHAAQAVRDAAAMARATGGGGYASAARGEGGREGGQKGGEGLALAEQCLNQFTGATVACWCLDGRGE